MPINPPRFESHYRARLSAVFILIYIVLLHDQVVKITSSEIRCDSCGIAYFNNEDYSMSLLRLQTTHSVFPEVRPLLHPNKVT